MTIRGAAAAAQNAGLNFALETSSTASALSIQSPLESTREYMRQLELETRRPGWDMERGRPVETLAWNRARVFLETCFEQIVPLPMPDVSASGDGYVHLVWFVDGRRAVVEVDGKRTHWTVLSGEAARVEENVDARDAIDKLRQFLRSE